MDCLNASKYKLTVIISLSEIYSCSPRNETCVCVCRCVKDMSASVLSDYPVAVKSRSLTQHKTTSDTSERSHPPPVKTIRQSSDIITSTFTLLTVTDLNPLLTSSSVTHPIILHYCTQTSARVSHHCGQISVDIKDLHTEKMNPRLLQDTKLNSGTVDDGGYHHTVSFKF